MCRHGPQRCALVTNGSVWVPSQSLSISASRHPAKHLPGPPLSPSRQMQGPSSPLPACTPRSLDAPPSVLGKRRMRRVTSASTSPFDGKPREFRGRTSPSAHAKQSSSPSSPSSPTPLCPYRADARKNAAPFPPLHHSHGFAPPGDPLSGRPRCPGPHPTRHRSQCKACAARA